VRRWLAFFLVLFALGAAAALAQEVTPTPAGPRAVGSYAGVTPGTGNLPPRAPRQPSEARLMTWPGFQARPDGASRFFIQTTQPVVHEMRVETGRVVILLKQTRLHLRNNRRPLETRYFNTPVSRAWIERRGHDLAFVLELRAQATPVVSTQPAENGYHYLFVELPAGDYLPAELRTRQIEATPPPDDRGSDEETYDSTGLDDEAPPAFQ